MKVSRSCLSLAARSCCFAVASFFPLASLLAQDSAATKAVSAAVSIARSGDSAKARTVLDSLITSASDPTARSDAAFWRAQFSPTPTDKEKALTAFVVDYPFSAHTGESYFALGMLEFSHGDRDRAVTHLTQFLAASPNDSNRSTASLTLSRVLFDLGESGRGCAVALNGRAELPASAVEVRNKFDFLAGPCNGVDTSSAPKPRPDSTTTTAVDSTPHAGFTEYYTVQVAAYDTKTQADRLATRLRGSGYEARVIGTKKPFRVRVGHYTTHTAADAASKKIEALVKLKPFVLMLGPEDM